MGRYLYRLLRDDEDITYGIVAQHPEGNGTIENHVLRGSGWHHKCQYISTTNSYASVVEFAGKKFNKENMQIVIIDRSIIENNPDICIYDLTDPYERDLHLEDDKAKNFARKFQEVIVKGSIPRNAIVEVRELDW